MKSSLRDWHVTFRKPCVFRPHFADSAVIEPSGWAHRFIFEIYMKMSVWVENPRSHWRWVLLIADDISVTGSWISVPGRKAVPWWGGCPAANMTISCTFSVLVFLHRGNTAWFIFSSFFVHTWEPFKSWSSEHLFCLAFCLSLYQLVSEAVDHALS